MPMYHQRWEYPEWLGPIGILVDDWVTDPRIRQRFQDNLARWYNEYRSRDKPSGVVKCPNGDLIPGGPLNPVVLLPSRAMTRPEMYAALCAIHDVACKDAKPLRPWRKERLKDRAAVVGVAYACLKKQACELTDGQYARVLDVVRDVARDLRKPNPFRRKPDRATLILQSVEQTLNVSNRRTSVKNIQNAPARGGSPSGVKDEMRLADASREFDVPTWALTRASQKPKDTPGHMPTRRVGNNVLVKRQHAKAFAVNFDARREQRVVGSNSKEGRNIVAALRKLRKSAPRKTRRKTK